MQLGRSCSDALHHSETMMAYDNAFIHLKITEEEFGSSQHIEMTIHEETETFICLYNVI